MANGQRGSTDHGREDLYNDQFFTERVESARYPGDLSREDTPSEFQRRQIHSRMPELDRIAKLAVVTGGVALAGAAIGRKNLIKMMSSVGQKGYAFRDIAVNPLKNLIDDVVLGPNIKHSQVAGRYLDEGKHITPDLAIEVEQMYKKYSAIGGDALRWQHEGGQTGVDLHRNYLGSRYHGRTAPEGLKHLTVDDILQNPEVSGRFSPNSVKVLQRARAHGVVGGQFSVSDSNLFGLFKDESGKMLDTQFGSGQRVFDAVHNTLRKFEVPFVELKPADLIFGAIRPMLWKGRHQTIGGGVQLPGGVKTGHGLNFNIGGDIYSQVGQTSKFAKVASGMKVYDVSRPGSHFYGRAVASKQGLIASQMDARLTTEMASRTNSPVKHFFQRAQSILGVGPEFATNRSVVGLAKDALERHAIDRGKAPGEFVRNAFVPRRATLTKRELVEAQSLYSRGRLPGQSSYGNVDEYLDEAVAAAPDGKIPLYQRIKEKALGDSRVGSYYRTPPTPGNAGVRVGDVPNARKPTQGYTPAGGGVLTAGPGGAPATAIPASGVVDVPGALNTANLFMHHATERLNQLIGSTTGMGFRPTKGQYGWVGNLAKIYGMAAGVKMGLEGAKYGDFLAGEAMDFVPGMDNTTPSEYGVKAYTSISVARQKLRETIGLQQAAAYAEGLMPGSTSLPGITALRTLGPIIAGLYKGGRKAGFAGAALSGLIGGKDLDMSSQELSDIYSGKKNIAVMKSRWWMMGLQPFEGNDVEYYRPHWAARYQSNFRYTSTQYGSKSEYFANASSLPTPHNLFGLKKILDPNHYAKKHYKSRPYPYSSSGERMHPGEDVVLSGGSMSAAASDIGYEPSPGAYMTGSTPTAGLGMMSKSIDQITELGGIYKFAAEQLPFYQDLFGGKAHDKYAADASTITSFSREFYDESLGGMLGGSELLRRFLDPDQGRQGINLIANEMPDWMPGARSVFSGDRDYYTDFTLGDPYAKIKMGEARLPGAGLESLRPLHSGTPGVYDAYDRYKILADVAPYSDSFKHYRAIVSGWLASGALDKSWRVDMQQTEDQVESILDGPEYTARRFSGVRSGTPEQLAAVNKYSAPERAIGAVWESFTHDLIPAVGRSIPLFGTILDRKLLGQRSAYESYLEDQVYGADFQDWSNPYTSFARPRIQNLIGSDPATAGIGGAALGLFMGATPAGVALGVAGGIGIGAASAGRMMATGQARGGWTPGSFDERVGNEAYFDALEYERAMRNMSAAGKAGQGLLKSRFRNAAQRTAVGMDYSQDGESFLNSAKFRLGSPMKDYAWQFLRAPEEGREAIMSVASPMAAPILGSAWARQGDTRFNFRPQGHARGRADELLSMYGTPDDDWEGWAPDIPMESIKIKTLDSYYNQAYDMHRYNLWESDRITTTRSYPGLHGAF